MGSDRAFQQNPRSQFPQRHICGESKSPTKSLQHRFGIGFGDAEDGAGGAFGKAGALFPVLEGAGADADEEGGESILDFE